MKKLTLFIFTLLAAFSAYGETKTGKILWTEDWKAAKAQAIKENKDIFLFFTGSDWCTWCHALQNEVLTDNQFIEMIGQKYVFMMADFPQGRPIPSETTKQNETLQEKYRVEGYPTVYLLDGKSAAEYPLAYARTGYQAGGGEKYAKNILGYLAKRDLIRTLLGAVDAGKTDKEKALKINELFTLLEDSGVEEFYKKDLMEKLKNLKAPDAQDVKKKFEYKTRLNALTESWTDKTLWREKALADLDTLLAEVDKVGSKDLLKTVAQDILIVKASVLIQVLQAREEGLKVLKLAKDRAPDSRFGQTADALIKQIQGEK